MNGVANMVYFLNMRGGKNKIEFCNKSTLKDLYLNKRLSSIEIGEKFNVGKHVVLSRLKEYGITRRTISQARKGKFDGENCPSYKGAIYSTPSGYLMKKLLLSERGSHRCDPANRVYVHTYTMEKYIGRKLKPSEVVHHVDCVRYNNDISNLILFPNQDAHIKFHKFVESLGMYDLGILKEKPTYNFPKGTVVPKESDIKI